MENKENKLIFTIDLSKIVKEGREENALEDINFAIDYVCDELQGEEELKDLSEESLKERIIAECLAKGFQLLKENVDAAIDGSKGLSQINELLTKMVLKNIAKSDPELKEKLEKFLNELGE